MTSVSIAVRIWARTLISSAVLWSMLSLLAGNFFVAFISAILLIGAFVVTLPLLMLIAPLVRLSAWLPYSVPARTAWLTFWLAFVIFLLYVWVSGILSEVSGGEFILNAILVSILTGLLFAVITTRKSLNKFYSAS